MFGVFLGVGCFLFAVMRAAVPKLAMVAIFATIARKYDSSMTSFFSTRS
jgi:hypothetical protein